MKYLGDVTKINGAEIEPVDVLTGGSPCFPDGVLVLTEGGYIPIEDVEIGMRVLTHTGRWQKVTAVGSKIASTIVLRGNHYGLECTPNHPIYSTGERKYYPYLENGKRGNMILLTDDKDWIPASDMLKRLWAVPNYADSLPYISPNYADDPVALMYFIGRWLGDGWVQDGQRSGRPVGQMNGKICLCDSEDKEDEVRDAIEGINVRTYHIYRHNGVVRYTFYDKNFCNWLTTNFGKYAYGKTMPGWVFGMPCHLRGALLQGYLDSDGWQSKPTEWKVITASKKLAESIRLLGEIQGYSTTVYFIKVKPIKEIEGRLVNQRDQYQVALSKGVRRKHLSDSLHGWYRVRRIEPGKGAAIVHNLTVEEDNSYVADGIVVHNCQDLSVAGKREGLGGSRSSLFLEQIRIVKEMRKKDEELRRTDESVGNGRPWVRPRVLVWENVAGVYSSGTPKGGDFKAVLEEVIKVVEPEAPPLPFPEKGKWPDSGMVYGVGWSVAWTTHDAQYFGVPQRRKRVSLVADYGGLSAYEVLSKCDPRVLCGDGTVRTLSESLSGNPEQSGEKGQGTAGGIEDRPFATSR